VSTRRSSGLVVGAGATIDLRTARAFYVPKVHTIDLPICTGLEGCLLWDIDRNCLVTPLAGAWEPIAFLSNIG